ncbi:MAG: hypothetical protein IIC50_07670 [Planctomycetes bacterium]|nr:hypothetical protein [Planctomycetota bacterium]
MRFREGLRQITLGFVGQLRRRPESEPFFRLAKTEKQAMFVLSSMQPDAARREKGRSKPDRVFRHSLIGLLALSTALAARPDQAALLPDGLLLRGIDGQVAFDIDLQAWFFESRTVLSDPRSTVPKGVKLQLLPSGALDSLQIDLGQRTRSDYRLWAKTTLYEGKNYLFVHHYLPLAPMEPTQSSELGGESPRNGTHVPVDNLGIPIAIEQRRAAKKRVERPSVASAKARKPNTLMLDRVGYLVQREGHLTFTLDGLGLQLQTRQLSLLPCRLLTRMQKEQRASLTPVHFRIAGLITEYQGHDYLMVQRAAQVHDYGNFGR